MSDAELKVRAACSLHGIAVHVLEIELGEQNRIALHGKFYITYAASWRVALEKITDPHFIGCLVNKAPLPLRLPTDP